MESKASKVSNPVKRWHRKVRTGCVQCRRRRVKCDEDTPSCRNCRRSSMVCEYASGTDTVAATPKQNLAVTKPITRQPAAPVPLSHEQLELMHHFCVSTCGTMGEAPQLAEWFRDVPPRLLLGQGDLIGAVLSVAASHRVVLQPEGQTRSLALASMHLDQAVISLRDGINDLNNSNGAALNLAGIFIGIAWTASVALRSTLEHADPVEKFVRVSSAVRGGRTIAATLRQRGVAIDPRYLPPADALPPLDKTVEAEWDGSIADVAEIVQDHLLQCGSKCELGTHDMYLAVLDDLRIWVAAIFRRPPPVSSRGSGKPALEWSSFCSALLAGDQLCLLFALCYASFMTEVDHRWYVQGFFGELVGHLAPRVALMGPRAATLSQWAYSRIADGESSSEGAESGQHTPEGSGQSRESQ